MISTACQESERARTARDGATERERDRESELYAQLKLHLKFSLE